METRSIAFECIQHRIHSFICSLHSWQDILSDHARFDVVPKERFVCDLRQPSTHTKPLLNQCILSEASTVDVYY